MRDAQVAEIIGMLPESQRDLSGTALYTGLSAWTNPSPIYLMGINPGGAPGPDRLYDNTVRLLTDPRFDDYSEYRDGSWGTSSGRARQVGGAPMQRRVRHLLDVAGLDPGLVPSTNMVFARSAQAAHIAWDQMARWAEECWESFHAPMINRLGAKVVVCMGHHAGRFVASKLGADTKAGTYRETLARRHLPSYLLTGRGISVVSLTHPGRHDWTNPDSDPTALVVRALAM